MFLRAAPLFISMSGCIASVAYACPDAPDVSITAEDIFDLEDPETIWVHRMANSLHVVTHEETLENEIAFLKEKCEISDDDLREVERHLRKLKYINTAQAVKNDDGSVHITTSDKWSLMPTLDFSRKGGNNKFALGIKDRNLLGYGIDAEISYFSDVQRSGYIIDTRFPLFTANNLYGAVTLTDTDDGSAQGISIIRPFVSFDTNNAFFLSAYKGDLSQQFFLNGDDYFSLDYSDRLATASWGRIWTRDADAVTRYSFGVDYESREFTGLDTQFAMMTPPDREYLVPFIEVEYLQDNFRELTNVRVINQIEDFNLGWHFTTRFGVNVSSRDNDESLFVTRLTAAKGSQLTDDMLLLSDISLTSNVGNTSRARQVLDLNNELFYRLSPEWGLYGAQHLNATDNQYLDIPVVIGEENGVRGYPLEYQRGNSRVAFTGEVRYYPNINIYNLFELGAAAYVDAGRVYGTEDFAPQKDQWLSSVGVGARFYSRQASDTKVIHVDVSFPMQKDDNVNNVEFLVTTKASF